MSIVETLHEEGIEEDVRPPIDATDNGARKSKLRERLRDTAEKPKAKTDEEEVPVDGFETVDTGTAPKGFGSKALQQHHESENKSLAEWLSSFGDAAAIKVHVKRVEPKWIFDPEGNRISCAGLLETFERTITEEEVQAQFGGGKYQLVVQMRGTNGKYQYKNAKSFEIAGEPLMTGLTRPNTSKGPTIIQAPEQKTDPLAVKAFDMFAKQMERSQNTPAPVGPSTADQMALVSAMLEPMRSQNAALVKTIDSLQTDLREARKGDPTETSFTAKMMDKLIDQDSARILALRTQYEGEIRVIKENAREDEKRARDSYDRDKQYILNQHDRELAAMRAGHERELANIRASHELAVKILEKENHRLEKDNAKVEIENVKLRDKKDQSMKDKIDEVQALKDLVSDGDGDEKSTIMRLVEGVAGSPVVAGLAERMMQGGQAQAQVAQAQVAQAQQPSRKVRLLRDKRTNQMYATDGQRQIPVTRVQPPPQTVTAPDGTTTVVEQPPAAVPIPYVDPDNARTAAAFMLNAFQNGTPPDTFADSARPHIPKEILGILQSMSIDDFMTKVAQLEGVSPLRTQAGRNWCRKVVRHLLGEAEE